MGWSLPRAALGYASLALGYFRSPLPGAQYWESRTVGGLTVSGRRSRSPPQRCEPAGTSSERAAAALDQGDGLTSDYFAASDRADAFPRLGFHVHRFWFDS